MGNPNLKPEHANDFDVLYEHYLKPYGMIRGSFFTQAAQRSHLLYSQPERDEPVVPHRDRQAARRARSSMDRAGTLVESSLHIYSALHSCPARSTDSDYPQTILTPIPRLQGCQGVRILLHFSGLSAKLVKPSGPSYDRGRVSAHVGMSYNGPMIYQYQYTTASDPSNLGLKGPAGDIYTLLAFPT